MVKFEDIKFDCRLYNGYKPCRYGNQCHGCPFYDPDDPATPGWKPVLEDAPLANIGSTPRICIIKTGALGDVLRTTTLLHPIIRAYPGAHITWITAESALPLLSANPHIQHLVSMESPELNSVLTCRFDALICLEKEGAPLALAAEINATSRAGYYPTPWNTASISNCEARYMMVLGVSDELKFFKNEKSYPQLICEAVGLPFARDPYILPLSPSGHAAFAKLRAFIASSGLPGKPVVGLNTGCGSVFRTKQWTLDGWANTARTLLEHGTANVVLMGGAAERELNALILARVPEVIDAGCDNSLEQFAGIMENCDIVITSDSLGMHIAIAREKYVVALFGSTSHQEIDLYDRGEKVITDFPCSPCYLKTCDKNPMCMEEMSASSVVAAVIRGLDSLQRPRGSR